MSEQDPWSALREKMNSLDHMPGVETPSTESIWNHVKKGMQRDKRRRRIYRCSIAASFTIIFSVLLSLSTNKNSAAPEAGGTHHDVVQATPVTITLPAESTLLQTAPPKNAISKTTMVQPTKKKNHPSGLEAEPLPLNTTVPEMLVQTPTPQIMTPMAPAIAMAVPAAKPRIQMIHTRDMDASPFFTNKPGVDDYEVIRLVKQKSKTNTAIATSSKQDEHILSNN